MYVRLLSLSLCLMLAVGAAAPAHAQNRKGKTATSPTVLPVLDKTSGRLQGVLLLEPTGAPVPGRRWGLGKASLDAAFGLDAGDSLGLVCEGGASPFSAIGSLAANRCLLAAFDGDGARRGSAGLSVSQGQHRFGFAVGSNRDTLPAWLAPNGQGAQFDENALTLIGQRNIGREATVSIGGSVAHAKLYPAGEIPSQYADRWTTKSLTVGGTVGKFGASVIGRVVEVPGQTEKWEGVGLGLSWRTPWSGQLTIGAENIVTRGKNPFAPDGGAEDEGTVPYVQYKQDL